MNPLDVIEGRARWCVVEGDSADVLASLPPASVHALVTDPPAGIGFMGREWDRDRGGRAQWVAWLASVLGLARVAVRPGGRAFVWALPRTTHWTGCAVEDAGWSIETVVTHLFGTGWPKGASQLKPSSEHWYLARTGPSTALNVDGCRVGTESTARQNRAPMGYMGNAPAADGYTTGSTSGRWPPNTLFTHSPGCERVGERRVRTGGAPEWVAGRAGNTNAYGKATVRPAHGHADPDGTELVEAWRCVEGCPVAELDAQSGDRPSGSRAEGVRKGLGYGSTTEGDGGPALEASSGPASRFFPCFPADDPAAPFAVPAGLDSGASGFTVVGWDCADQSPVAPTGSTSPARDTCAADSTAALDSPTLSSGSDTTALSRPGGKSTTSTRTSRTTASKTSPSSTPPPTSASMAGANSATANGGSPAACAARSSESTPGNGTSAPKGGPSTGGAGPATSALSFETSSGDGQTASFAYIPKPSRAEKRAGLTDEHGSHCTVKPVALMRWLLRLITEPGDIVLDPFGGSGTTGVAALLEGRRVILVERDPAFAAICRARLSHAAPTAATLTARVAEPIEAPAADFGPLFGGAR